MVYESNANKTCHVIIKIFQRNSLLFNFKQISHHEGFWLKKKKNLSDWKVDDSCRYFSRSQQDWMICEILSLFKGCSIKKKSTKHQLEMDGDVSNWSCGLLSGGFMSMLNMKSAQISVSCYFIKTLCTCRLYHENSHNDCFKILKWWKITNNFVHEYL